MSAFPVNATSIFEALPKAEKRKWELERRVIREGIRRAEGLSRRERDGLMYCANLWFYHRNGEGFIRPGAKLLASKLECCERTAKSVFKKLREAGYLIPLEYLKGGHNATRYAVDLALIIDMHCPFSEHYPDQWDDIKRRSVAHVNRAKFAANRAKVARGIEKAPLVERPRESFDDASDWSEVPF